MLSWYDVPWKWKKTKRLYHLSVSFLQAEAAEREAEEKLREMERTVEEEKMEEETVEDEATPDDAEKTETSNDAPKDSQPPSMEILFWRKGRKEEWEKWKGKEGKKLGWRKKGRVRV